MRLLSISEVECTAGLIYYGYGRQGVMLGTRKGVMGIQLFIKGRGISHILIIYITACM
ncbi:hypothetical protein BDZ91DRAFT_713751 [Kalaharituber pfeilii]|nr:hypothetical protein BDZ91DRAFT_713751 [Kalaharituber pfeilii]